MSFRDRFFTPQVARAITSPSAIVATGAGAALGIVAIGLTPVGIVGAAGLGLAALAARVAAAIPRGPKKQRIDPFTLSEPWRNLTQDALAAQRRFHDALRRARPGPLRDTLTETGARLDDGVSECWRTAQSGHALSAAYNSLDVAGVERELHEVRGRPEGATTEATVAALQAQLDVANRMYTTLDRTRAQLQLLNAKLDEAVTRTIELTTTGADDVDVTTIDADVSSVTTQMEALRQGLEATAAAAATA